MSNKQNQLTVSNDVVKPHGSVVNIMDIGHTSVDVQALNKHPGKRTQEEVVKNNGN
jgi:hypothetical protein